ncbi:MAG TPA: diacylglycerol kinase family protein [Micromonosporaceae bacterium]
MRALLLVNPAATTTSARSRDVLVRALRSEVDLEVASTKRRGHAAAMCAEAARGGVDLVVTLGGDGTVNEAVNGLLADGPGERVPALAVVPGGSTNVFARALGLPRDWTEGAAVILEALREGRSRSIGLGRADERYFTFCAGLGFDAEVIRRVEQYRLRGRVASPSLYLQAMAERFVTKQEMRHTEITLERPAEEPVPGLSTVVVQNTSPWTYFGGRPVDACPQASFDLGLDLMAMKGLRVPSTMRALTGLLRPGVDGAGGPRGKRVFRLHDVAEFTLCANGPVAFQVDGDYLGEREKVTFTSVSTALRVIV